MSHHTDGQWAPTGIRTFIDTNERPKVVRKSHFYSTQRINLRKDHHKLFRRTRSNAFGRNVRCMVFVKMVYFFITSFLISMWQIHIFRKHILLLKALLISFSGLSMLSCFSWANASTVQCTCRIRQFTLQMNIPATEFFSKTELMNGIGLFLCL